MKEVIKNKEDDDITLVREFRDDFKKMIDKSKIKKLVVIIDDLDRCTHERIIENLEAIKLFLNVEKTAFIIGADPRIVRHAIEYRYKTEQRGFKNDSEDKNDRLVNDYLEKLIQIPYTLPRLSDNEVETYMTLLFSKKELTTSYAPVLTAFTEFRQKNRYGVFGFADIQHLLTEEEKKQLAGSISLIASLSSVITQGLNGNPRQIKRFLNTFTLRLRLATIASIPDFRIDVLAKLMVLEYTFPKLFAELHSWQESQNGESKELLELETSAAKGQAPVNKEKYNSFWQDPQVIKWLSLEPKLSAVDLRDYFWIARDQLFSSLSGSSLIPPHIRSLFKSLVSPGSDSILKTQVTKEVLPLSSPHLSSLFSLLEKELIKNPDNTNLHKAYIECMAQNTPNSIDSYKKAIAQIGDHNAIPFSLQPVFVLAKRSNSEIEEIEKIFKPDSQIFKRFKNI